MKQLAVYAVLLMAMIFIAQYFGIRYHIQSLHEAERKIDYARTAQINSQQISLHTQSFVEGNKHLATDISTKLDRQDYLLKTLSEGGRIDGSEFFIKPLSLLPRITFENLRQSWDHYKAAVMALILDSSQDSGAYTLDSLSLSKVPIQAENNILVDKAKLIHESRWLSMSDWFNKLIVDLEEEVETKQQATLNWFIFFILIDLGVIAAMTYSLYRLVLQPLQSLEFNILNRVHTSEINKNEIGKVTHEINEIIENLKDATEFVSAISEGKLDMDYKQTLDIEYTPGKNKLADSLIEMQKKLKSLNEDEQKRQWANEGITKFVEIMRSSNDNLQALGDSVISTLVQYTHSNQGALYILNDEDQNNKYLELISLFAFDIKKFEQRKIKLGEGILGQTFLEKELTYITNMPEEYIRITSGLGDANPKSLLLFPLKVDRDAYGIIELASFNEYAPHEISFVEKLGESIAATLSSVKAAQKNRQLIEQFQQQTEEMRAQEEEMRQNMEELQATQEEIGRKEQAYVSRIKELENGLINSSPDEAVAEFKEKAILVEKELQLKIDNLQQQLSKKPAPGDDWAVAEEAEKTFRISLEALKITKEELNRREGF